MKTLKEQYLYGSKRLGVRKPHVQLAAAPHTAMGYQTPNEPQAPGGWFNNDCMCYTYEEPVPVGGTPPPPANTTFTARFYTHTLGKKEYELTNHASAPLSASLGNVLATVLDRKTGVKASPTATTYAWFKADVTTAQDYYPFGSLMPGRTYVAPTGAGYRFGFNGKENDNEINGVGNQQNYGFRVYDPRLGRFLSVDPLSPDYPELTPFQFASNTPIWAIDIDGLEAGYTVSFNVHIDKNGNYVTQQLHAPVLTTTSGKWSGVKVESQFFHNGSSYKKQSSIPGWSSWKDSRQKGFNDGFRSFALGTMSVFLSLPTGGSSLGLLAISTGAASVGLGGFKLYQAADGKVEEYKYLPLGLGEAAGGFIGEQFGNEQLGQSIGGFGEALISGKGAIKDLPKAFLNKDALDIVQGMQSLYETGTSGYEAYESIANEIQSALDQD